MVSDKLKIDFHVHTIYSHDACVKIEELVELWHVQRILSIVCDHDTLAGSRIYWKKLREMGMCGEPIYGEEITTIDGEIIGLFLNDEIPAGLPAVEAVDMVHEQEGLVLIPHPFDRMRKRSIRSHVLDSLVEKVDIIEGFNSRVLFHTDNEKAVRFGSIHGKPIISGSDAHTRREIGKVFTQVDPFETNDELIENLKHATHVTGKSGLLVHVMTKMQKAFK